jgi:hypothetical protein
MFRVAIRSDNNGETNVRLPKRIGGRIQRTLRADREDKGSYQKTF